MSSELVSPDSIECSSAARAAHLRPLLLCRYRAHIALLALTAILVGSIARAEESSTGQPAPDVRIRGIFDTELPRTEWRRHLRLIFHPHFGDFSRHDFLRIPLGFRYGLTDQWEATAEIEGYLAHGFGAQRFGSSAGIGSIRLATKYHWTEWLQPFVDTAAGISIAAPLETPPADVSDRLFHVTPYITFAHTLESLPNLMVFVSMVYDDVTPSRSAPIHRRNAFVDDSWSFTPGFVWTRGSFRYTCEAGVASTFGVSPESLTVLSIRPAVSWDIPKKLFFKSEGRWVVGLGMPVSFGPDGHDVGLSAKFRGDFDFKRLLGRPR
jgi:hypothetical protein